MGTHYWANMSWVHCNRCGLQPSGSKAKPKLFFLTSCFHLFCESCVKLCRTEHKCPVCFSSPVQYIQVKATMKEDVQVLFVDISSKISTAFRRLEFQLGHFRTLISLLKNRVQTLELASREGDERVKRLEEELEREQAALEEVTLLLAQAEEQRNSSSSPKTGSPGQITSIIPGAISSPVASRRCFKYHGEGDESDVSTFHDMAVNAFSNKTPSNLKPPKISQLFNWFTNW